MSFTTSMFARLRLESSGIASRLAKMPMIGTLLRGIGNRLLPRGTLVWTCVQRGPARGLWLLLDVRTGAEQRRGEREPVVQEAIRNSLSSGNVFYDLGANVGFFSLMVARQVGPDGKVIAFEPDMEIAERLRRAAERNRLSNVTVVEAAVYSKKGVVAFERGLASPDRGIGHVTGSSEGANHVPVQAITLDDYVKTAAPPHLIKCDVEGAEVEVFRGASKLLATQRPSVICEVHSQENLETLRILFRNAGYNVKLLEPDSQSPVHIFAEAAR